MARKPRKALVYVWTGMSSGKTTNALGAALRTVGHGKRAVIVQFMKGRADIGEVKVMRRLAPEYEIRQFGREGWVNPAAPGAEDRRLARAGLAYARKAARSRPHLLVLDELCLVLAYHMLPVKDVLRFLDEVPPETAVFITGRFCPYELMARADYVTEVVQLKRPEKVFAREGIEY
jgi:cob(I)alamin adenosyltransferase